MNHGGDALRKFRRARRLTVRQLDALTAESGRRVSASQIGKVERGERILSDEVYDALASALALTDDERDQVDSARAGGTAVDLIAALGDMQAVIEAKITSEATLLRGELRGAIAQVLAAIERTRTDPN